MLWSTSYQQSLYFSCFYRYKISHLQGRFQKCFQGGVLRTKSTEEGVHPLELKGKKHFFVLVIFKV